MNWKTYFTDGLVQIAVVLSLFRTDWNNYLNTSLYDGYPEMNEILMGPVSAYTQSMYAPEWHSGVIGLSHPKALSMDYRSSIFRDIHQLANYQRFDPVSTDFNAYLVNGPVQTRLQSENAQTSQGHAVPDQPTEDANNNNNNDSSNNMSGADTTQNQPVDAANSSDIGPSPEPLPFEFAYGELTKEDLDLIEILWRQDIDLGAERDAYDAKQRKQQEKDVETEIQQQIEKEKELEKKLAEEQNAQNNTHTINYIVDQETGELIRAPIQTNSIIQPPSEPLPVPDVLQETPQLVQLQPVLQPDQQQTQQLSIEDAMRLLEESTEDFTFESQNTTQNAAVQQELQDLEAMIDNVTQSFEQQPELQRQTSIEQRWQDISLMLGSSTNDTSYEQQPLVQNASLLQNASFAPPLLLNNMSSAIEGFGPATYQPLAPQPLTPIDITQPHLLPTDALGLNDTSLITRGGPGAFVNSSASLLQHLLNDNLDDLNFTDMNITNSTEAMETSDMYSDSAISSAGSSSSPTHAVSSIGSPTQDLSDFRSNISSPYDALEGATGGNNEGESPSYQSMKSEYKYEPDQSYTDGGYSSHDGRRLYSNSSDGSNSTDFSEHELPADPRKVNHNHSYPLQPGQEPKIHKKAFKQELDTTDIQYNRDQKRAKAMNIPFSMEDMITSTVETFNEMLQEHTLSESQLQLVRDIRRRGKNKVAAQNCRKRKLEVIQSLDEEVAKLREDRDRLQKERHLMDKDLSQMKQKYSHAYQEVFQSLRDEHDRPYDPNEYTLQQTDDGEMLLVPHNATSVINDEPKSKSTRKRKADRKH